MATTARSQHASNGVLVAPPKGVVGGNRKKQKRRAKQAAKAVSQEPAPLSPTGNDVDYDEDPLGYADEDDYEYSDAEQAQYAADRHHYAPPHDGTNGHTMSAQPLGKKSKKKKKRSGTGGDLYDPDLPLSNAMTMRRGNSKQNIWNTTSQQERHNIRNFWLSLSEDERKSLLKIEKEAVLRKMKQQQKHSCSCTVCGRKRTAIEEELEVLYEGYYEELEQYAHHDHPTVAGSDGMLPAPLAHPHAHRPTLTAPAHSHHRTSQIMEHLEDDEAEYSDDEAEYSEEEYSDEELEPPRGSVPDFFSFGQNLTVKDNLLTVADDLLKNDGRKFIEMMEQLAERRMQRENEAEYAAQNPNHSGEYPPNDQGYANDDSMAPSDEFDDDDEASYDSQEDYDDELEDDDEMASLSGNPDLHRLTAKQNALTEEQRMQEGRRMFQIFAARMFEHRVLTAYKEKVAAERQQKLLEELQNEEQLEAQREAKKKRDAEKKKDKKKQQQAVKAEERAKKEAEKAAEESRLREAEERKQEELRQRKEEQRRKKEEERRKLEEERMKKEADRLRRQQEEQTRREEAERKIRESKAAEKARKEDARKKEKELKEARERKAGEEKDKQDRDTAKAKALTVNDTQPRQIVKRPSHTQMVAVPGVLTKQSPKPAAAQTAPRAATSRYKEASPQKPQSHVSSTASNSTSPGVIGTHNHAPKTILQKPLQMQPPPPPPQQQQQQLPFSHMHTQGVLPPPGMPMPMQQQAPPHHIPSAFSPLPPNNFQAFQQNQAAHTMQGGMRSPMPGYPAPLNVGRFQPVPGMNGAHGPPPGIMASQGRGYGFDAHAAAHAPPGFGPSAAHMPGQTLPINVNAARTIQPTHSRQQSVNEKPFDPAIGQPLGRQAPIKRPSSAKQDENVDLDNLSKQLGSSALGGDDEPAQGLTRKTSQRNRPLDTFGSMGGAGSTWSTPFAPTPVLGQQWGALPQNSMSGWTSNAAGFGAIMPGRPMLHAHNRPLTIRIAVCQACQALSGGASQRQEYHDINQLLHFIDRAPPPLDSPPTLNEIELICETEGTEQNGGGELSVRKANNGTIVAVKWQPSNAPVPDAGRIGVGSLGEIGSPLPGKSTPAIGFGAPGMGRSSASGPSGSWHGHGGGF